MNRPNGLAPRLLTAQLLVIALGALTLLVTVFLVAPSLFTHHLDEAGENNPEVQQHAREAFEYAVGIALTVATTTSVLAAAALSWILTRRVSQPIEDLATAAQTVASGNYNVTIPDTGFGRELHALSRSFGDMAHRLAATDEARGRLLADLAHEIRTPLATLEAHIDGLEDHVVEPSPETYDLMRAQAARLRRLADDIRQAADAQEHALQLHPTTVPVDAIVATACAAATPRYQAAGVTLQCRTAAGCGAVHVDTDRIQQVLTNLLDNALRHTPAAGRVTVTAARTHTTVAIDVTDTGDGIPTDQLDAVFDRFTRIDSSRQHTSGGSGLGLTIARAIVNDHGGTLTATSPGPGQGATLHLTIPADGVE